MSVDKAVDSTQLDNDLESVADEIRAKTGDSNNLSFPEGFIRGIRSLTEPLEFAYGKSF